MERAENRMPPVHPGEVLREDYLARYFGGDAASWLVMQVNHDLRTLPTLKDIERQVRAREDAVA